MGREIVQRLRRRGHGVWVLHRQDHHDLGPDVRNLRADRADLGAVRGHLREHAFDVVFDNAYDWQRGTTPETIEATARACPEGLHRYVFMSSIAAYLPGLDRREEDPLVPDGFPNPYAAHKAGAERALFALAAERGLPVTTLRPPFVHGPRQPFYREQFFWDRLGDGRPIVLPDGGGSLMQWAYAADVAEAAVRAIEVPEAANRAFNIGHPEAVSQRQFVEALARAAGVAPAFVEVPRERIRAAGGRLVGRGIYFGEYLDTPPITEVIEKAQRVLGVRPTPFDEALREGFAWYSAQPRRPVDYTFEDALLAGR